MITLDVKAHEARAPQELGAWQQLRLLIRLQRHALPYWDKILLRLLCSCVLSFLLAIPILIQPRIVDDAFVRKDTGVLLFVVFTILACYLLAEGLGALCGTERDDANPMPGNVMGAYTLSRVQYDLKRMFFEHVQTLSLRFFATRPVGEHMFRSTADVEDAAYLASEALPKVVACLIRIAVLLMALKSFGDWLVVPVTGYLIVFFGVRQWLVTRVRRRDRQARNEAQRFDSVTREILYPWRIVRGYTMERTAYRWYGSQACRMLRVGLVRNIFAGWDSFVPALLLPAFVIVLNLFVGPRVLRGEMTIGEYSAVNGVVVQLLWPFQGAISTWQIIRQRLVPAERMLETLDVTADVADAPGARSLRRMAGNIELRDVSFAYETGVPVLEHVSLSVAAGEKVAIVGPTGAGKTTLTNLLLRLYDPDAGELLIDGVPYRSVRQRDLRRGMAVVPQNILTFAESIAANIRYGNPSASDERLRRAAALARVDEFASKLPHGLGTVLSEGGSLSGGQKQRLCLARALVRDAAVLILDEATSALDPVTEREVVENVDEAFAGRTRIVVAHNLLNARTADRIYVLDKGRIVETGTHEHLMGIGGLYKQLWTSEIDSAA